MTIPSRGAPNLPHRLQLRAAKIFDLIPGDGELNVQFSESSPVVEEGTRLVRQGASRHRCCARSGAAGVDSQTFEDIAAYGVERWLDELAQELKSRTYQPLPVRRVYIPKPDGRQRPIGVPAIRDRAAEMAAVLVLEPIFEADLPAEQYAYRRDRSALDAVRHVHKLVNTGHGEIVDADLSSYFDTLPHSELLKSVARRVVDGAMLHLIKMWLEAPVEETDESGNKRRSKQPTSGKTAHRTLLWQSRQRAKHWR